MRTVDEIIRAIKKKMDAAINSTMGNQPVISGPQPPLTVESARALLLSTNSEYRALDELLRFAKGEISDVSTDW